MATLARGFADELSKDTDITVYARNDGNDYRAHYPIRRVLTDNLRNDRTTLAREPVDAWLALNGGLIPIVRHLDKPFFVYLHGSDFLNPWISYGSAWMEAVKRPYMAVVRKSLRRASLRRHIWAVRHFFVNSARTAELAVKTMGIDQSRISICPPGVDDRFFQDRKPVVELRDNDSIRLLTVTRLTQHSARKNVDGVLEAISAVAREFDISYTVVGDGDDRARLEVLASELGIAERVRFAGRLCNTELLECYRGADLFILAAKATNRDIEGFGIVYMEASASGVPVICSRAGGAIDAVSEGANGLLIPDSSPSAIADGIRKFAAERHLLTPARARAVAERYRWEHVTADLRERLLDELGATQA
jgi:glycosyltransferase involved in cell wall biosynthesis